MKIANSHKKRHKEQLTGSATFLGKKGFPNFGSLIRWAKSH